MTELLTSVYFNINTGNNSNAEIYKDIRQKYGKEGFCKDFGQFCIVKTTHDVTAIRNFVRDAVKSKSNRYPYDSADIVVFTVGDKIAITRGIENGKLNDFARFFRNAD